MANNTDFFGRLQRLISNSVLIKTKGHSKIRNFDIDKIQSHIDLASNKFVDSQFSRAYSKSGVADDYLNAYGMSISRNELYADYELMDRDGRLASALDVYAEECVAGTTTIPLLDGSKLSIKELYDKKYTDFWVYSIDENNKFIPQKCERVAYNGKQGMYRITLDDGTIINATANHLWVKPNGELINTKDLQIDDSLSVFATTTSNNKTMPGYEKIKNNGTWDYTHRLVANNDVSLKLDKQIKRDISDETLYIHHASFDKRNNSPEKLIWLNRRDHMLEHAKFNKNLWSDPIRAEIYKEKSRIAHKNYWTPELRKQVSIRQRKFMQEHTANMTQQERNDTYGLKGNLNGMFGRNKATDNGNYNFKVKRPHKLTDEEISNIIIDIKTNKLNKKTVSKKYNLLYHDIPRLYEIITNKLSLKSIHELKSPSYELKTKYSLGDVRTRLYSLIANGVKQSKLLEELSVSFNTEKRKLQHFVKQYGYTVTDLVHSNNHKVKNIEKIGTEDAYDLVNVGNSHIYAIETNDGGKLFCHNCTTKSEYGKVLTIKTDNEEINDSLENLFYDILNINFNLYSWVRLLAKYGDMFLKLDITEKIGIVNAQPLSAYAVNRIETNGSNEEVTFQYTPDNANSKQITNNKDNILQNYEMIHMRLLADTNFLPFGKSILENGRKEWKKLILLEDAMLIQRIMRAPERRIFKIDVGNIPPNEVEPYMNQIIAKMKKTPFIDPKTGDYQLNFNLQNSLEDFFIPVRGGNSGTEIDTLSGMEWSGMDDIEYVMNNVLASLKIPRSFLTFEDQMNAKANLASEDVRFSRSVERIQRVVESELSKIAIIHLVTQGFDDVDLTEFELNLTISSKLAEEERIDNWSNKLSLATDFIDSKLVSRDWVYEHILNMTDLESDEEEVKIIKDLKLMFRYQQIEDEGNDPAETNETSGTDIDEQLNKDTKSKGLDVEEKNAKRKRLQQITFAKQIADNKMTSNKKQIIKYNRNKYRLNKLKKTSILDLKNILKD